MNQFIQAIDSAIELADNYSRTDENELLDHIFDNSTYQDAQDFAASNISYYDALELVQSHDSFVADAQEYLVEVATEPILTTDPAKLAYHLAYTDPEYGAKLIAELQYYIKQGRFS